MDEYVLVRLKRPEGYEDVHPELVLTDANINPAFQPELVTSMIDPRNGYEGSVLMSGPDKHSLHVFYSSRELADAAQAWFAADGVKAPHPGDALSRCFDCMWAGKSSCLHVGVKVPEPTLLQRAYEVGWVQCATWAERDDLITDCDSGAYTRERDAALAKLTAGATVLDDQAKPRSPK